MLYHDTLGQNPTLSSEHEKNESLSIFMALLITKFCTYDYNHSPLTCKRQIAAQSV